MKNNDREVFGTGIFLGLLLGLFITAFWGFVDFVCPSAKFFSALIYFGLFTYFYDKANKNEFGLWGPRNLIIATLASLVAPLIFGILLCPI